jgi:hypothetical protein
MKTLALAAALAVAALASAPTFAQDLVARQGNDSVRLSEAACASELVLGRLEAGQHEEFHAATAVFQGQNFVACWRAMGNVAFLLYEDGDQGVIPLQELKPDLSA